jgi:hypothetical protein
MTRLVEVLDALPGSGKTHAIINYMSLHQDKKWLYISPMLEETEERVPKQALDLGMEFFVPYEDKMYSKSDTCYEALLKGYNICCTHNLMYLFSKKHLEILSLQGYNVVSDEELNLINGYSIKKEDFDFLLKNKIIDIQQDGRVVFLDEDMSLGARYGDIKAKSDLGMLYAANRSDQFLVTQLSPKIIEAADRFILLTYNYKDSLMQVFLKMHKYDYKIFNEVTLWKTDEEIKETLRKRINIIETPSVKKIQNRYSLSKSWWSNAKSTERNEVAKAIRSVMKNCNISRDDMFYTVPKDYSVSSKGFNTKYIGNEPKKDSNGNSIDYTRTFIACNARSTNKYANKQLATHAYNLFPNQAVKAFIQGKGFYCNDEVYALNMLIQWLFRGCIRKKEGILNVAILSKRMSVLFKEWLINGS